MSWPAGSAGPLAELTQELGVKAELRVAQVDDPSALRAVTDGASAVINCAGPFSTTGEAVARAAIETGCHYLDHAAEPRYVMDTFERLDTAGQTGGVVVLPGMSFYGGLADLLADHVAEGWGELSRVSVGYAIAGWRMTTASKATAMRLNGADRVLYDDGALRVGAGGSDVASFDFPGPVGTKPVLCDYPAGEVVTIPRHVDVRSVRVHMTAETFRGQEVFTSEQLDPAIRARSEFLVAVEAEAPHGTRTMYVQGQDIYGTGAFMSVEAASRLVRAGRTIRAGVRSAAEMFSPAVFLAALREARVLSIHTPGE